MIGHTNQHQDKQRLLLYLDTLMPTIYLELYRNRLNGYLQVEERKICEVCSKVCLTIGNLNVHMRTHCLDKPYSCKLCDKTFKWNSSLNTHIQSAHSQQGFFKEINFRL